MEIWKSIPEYDGMYEASNFGRIKSFHRGDNVIKAYRNSLGYFVISLSKNKKKKTRYVHQLIAFTFLGERPFGMVVDHIDGKPCNNNSDNLQYISQSENILKGSGARHCEFHGSYENKHSKGFVVKKHFRGKPRYLGTYDTEQEAHDVFMKADWDFYIKFNENKRKFTKRKYMGVNLKNGKWLARKTINGKQMTVGTFKTELEAHVAWENYGA